MYLPKYIPTKLLLGLIYHRQLLSHVVITNTTLLTSILLHTKSSSFLRWETFLISSHCLRTYTIYIYAPLLFFLLVSVECSFLQFYTFKLFYYCNCYAMTLIFQSFHWGTKVCERCQILKKPCSMLEMNTIWMNTPCSVLRLTSTCVRHVCVYVCVCLCFCKSHVPLCYPS